MAVRRFFNLLEYPTDERRITMIKSKIKHIAKHPTTRKVVTAIKPEKSIWGFLGITLLLIVPEIIAFIWGTDITVFAKEALTQQHSAMEQKYYELLVMLFEEGGSWFNLAIGIALLIWFFF